MHDNHQRPVSPGRQSNPSLCCTPRDKAHTLDQCRCARHRASDLMGSQQRIYLLDAQNKCRNRLDPF